MQGSTCSSCRLLSRSRFHRRLTELQNGRRKFHRTGAREEAQTQPQSQPQPQSRIEGSWYWQTSAPTRSNLAAASHFFKHNIPTRIWTGEGWRDRQNDSQNLPEVIFLGRSNVGKSSVINALTSTDINRVSSVPGATKAMAAWTLAARTPSGGAIKGWDGDVSPKLTLVDMPGYGHGSHTEWGNSIVEYLSKRRNIRRAFVLIDVLHGVLERDLDILKILGSSAIPYQIVATKCDRFASSSKETQGEARSALMNIRSQSYLDVDDSLGLGEIIATGFLNGMTTRDSTRLVTKRAAFGVPNLQWAVLRAAALDEYAMQKADSHGVLKKLPAAVPFLPVQEVSVGDIDGEQNSSDGGSLETSTLTSTSTSTSASASASASAPTSTSTSLGSETSVSVEDFLREILNASPQKSSIGTQREPESKAERNGARIFSSLAPDQYTTPHSKRPSNSGGSRSSSSLLSDWLDEAESSSSSSSDFGSESFFATASSTGTKRSRGHGAGGTGKFQTSTATTTTTKTDAHHRRRSSTHSPPDSHASTSRMWSFDEYEYEDPPSRDSSAPPHNAAPTTTTTTTHVHQQSTTRVANANANANAGAGGGKGVLRGMDALQAMSSDGSDARSSSSKSKSKSKSKSRPPFPFPTENKFKADKAKSAGRDRHPHPDSQHREEHLRPPPPAVVAGKGVTRGMDALEAMLGNDHDRRAPAAGAGGKRKRTGTQRKR